MITEDYVSLEVAKLLKEKGFDGYCTHVYNIETGRNLEADFYTSRYVYNSWLDKNEPRLIVAPTLQMVMKWLREVHNLHCDIRYDDLNWFWNIISVSDDIPVGGRPKLIKDEYAGLLKYEEACEAAIKYCLENLI